MRTPASIAGHPIHPMLVPIPIGLWLFSLVCDIVHAAGNTNPDWPTDPTHRNHPLSQRHGVQRGAHNTGCRRGSERPGRSSVVFWEKDEKDTNKNRCRVTGLCR